MSISQLRSSLVGLHDSTYQNFIQFLLLVVVCFQVTLLTRLNRDFYPECSTEIRDRKLTWAEGDFSQYEIQLNA